MKIKNKFSSQGTGLRFSFLFSFSMVKTSSKGRSILPAPSNLASLNQKADLLIPVFFRKKHSEEIPRREFRSVCLIY